MNAAPTSPPQAKNADAAAAGPVAASGAPLIVIQRLTKYYTMGEHTVRALDGVDLNIRRGEFVAIIGPSGSGKSTMMHLLGCLDRPTSGRYVLNSRDVSRMSDRALAQVRNDDIGFVFQTFNLINRTTAVDNVGVPLFYARKSNTRGPARRALERVGLSARSTHRPSELSGGERQRVAIARAIVNDPVLLLADEPTGNLDSRTGEQIMEIFHDLNRQGVTIVLVTHEPEVALQARRIVAMRDGCIVSDRMTSELLDESSRVGIAPAALLYRPPEAAPGASESRSQPTPTSAAGADPHAPKTDAQPAAQPLRGAMASFVWIVIGLICYGVGGAIGNWVMARNPDTKNPASIPPMVALGMLATASLYLLYWVSGLLAVIVGARALNRRAGEVVAPTRVWLARLGLWLGALIVISPVVVLALNRLLR